MNIENVINKFNYPLELADFLRKLYPLFVDYFGVDKEPLIYDALLNTEIVKCDNVYSLLKSRGMFRKNKWVDENNEDLVTEGDLKRAAGVYQSLPEVRYDLDNKTYSIYNVKRLVAINCDNFNSNYARSTLIHELGHLIKGYYQEFKIEGDTLTERSGLIETKYKLYFENNEVSYRVSKQSGVGFEEGLNSIVEEDIAKIIVDPNYEVSGYGVVYAIAKIFFSKEEIRPIILETQLLGEKDKFIKAFDDFFMPGAYNLIENKMDKVYKLALEKYSYIFEPTKMKEISLKINTFINEEIKPILEEINRARQNKLGG